MSEQTLDITPDPTAPAEKRTQGPQTYVVQVERELASFRMVGGGGEPPKYDEYVLAWQDVATVTVPPRTKRSAVVKQALAEAGITPEPGKPAPRVRVLDEESAFVHEPEAKQPPAEWVIG